MRKSILLGASALCVVLGGAAAYAVPANSPYAVMVPPSAVDGYDDQGPIIDPGYGNSGMIEGRSTYVDPAYLAGDPGYGYGYDQGPVGGFYFGGGGGGFGRGGGHFHGGGHFGGGHGGGGSRHGR